MPKTSGSVKKFPATKMSQTAKTKIKTSITTAANKTEISKNKKKVKKRKTRELVTEGQHIRDTADFKEYNVTEKFNKMEAKNKKIKL